jgi:hypothetical protein
MAGKRSILDVFVKGGAPEKSTPPGGRIIVSRIE